MFEFFGFERCVDSVYYIVVRLLLLLLHLGELLEVFLPIDKNKTVRMVCLGRHSGELGAGKTTYDFFELPLETPAKAGGRALEIFGFIILLKV